MGGWGGGGRKKAKKHEFGENVTANPHSFPAEKKPEWAVRLGVFGEQHHL